MKLSELAARLDCQLEGDGDIDVHRVATLQDARDGDLSFLTNPRYATQLAHTHASAVIVAAGATGAPCATLRSDNPYLAFARATALLHPQERPAPGIHPTAIVADDATLGAGVSIGPYVVIESGVRIGERTVIRAQTVIGARTVLGADCNVHARVSIREGVQIGARVVIQDGAVLGSDGFGFAPRGDGTFEKIPQVATVVIEDDVEIGANTTIDRPAVGETRIKTGAKIDNLVQVAHGVVVGRNTMLAAQVGIAGSTLIGDDVMLGGQVGVTGHVTIGNRVKASAKTGVIGDVADGGFITGYPHMDNLEWRKAYVVFRRLPDMRRQLSALEERLAVLEAKKLG